MYVTTTIDTPPWLGHAELPAKPSSAGLARRFVRRQCGGLRRPEVTDDAELLASEVVTNAVVHARTTCTLRVETRGGACVRVEVADGAPLVPEQAPQAEMELAGRGLSILDAHASCWGFISTATNGKVVWFEVSAGEDEGPEGKLVDTLVGTAVAAVSLPPAMRPEAAAMAKRLAEIADGDLRAIRAAWDCCVDGFAECQSLSSMLAATYFIPSLLRQYGFDGARYRPPPLEAPSS